MTETEDVVDAETIASVIAHGRSGRNWAKIRSIGMDRAIARSLWTKYATRDDKIARAGGLGDVEEMKPRIYTEFLPPGIHFDIDEKACNPSLGRVFAPPTWVRYVSTAGWAVKDSRDDMEMDRA